MKRALRLLRGSPRESAIYARISSRTPALSMPPLATHLVDRQALALLARWIAAMGPATTGGPPNTGPPAQP